LEAISTKCLCCHPEPVEGWGEPESSINRLLLDFESLFISSKQSLFLFPGPSFQIILRQAQDDSVINLGQQF